MDLKSDINLKVDTVALKKTLINFVVPIVCVVLMGLLGGLVLYPTIKGRSQLQLALGYKRQLRDILQTKRAKLNDLLDFKAVVEETVSLVDSALVSEALVPELLTQINQIAQESGLSVSKLAYSFGESSAAMQPSVPVSQPYAEFGGVNPLGEDAPPIENLMESAPVQYETVTVSLGASGTYDQLITFLTNVEKASRVITVETYRYAAGLEEGVSALDISFVLVSPYLAVKSSAVTDDAIAFDINSSKFTVLVDKIKSLRHYDVYVDASIPLVKEETPKEEEELPTL